MTERSTRVVLASASPRRHELLGRLGVAFGWRAPDVDETPHEGEAPPAYVERIARRKAVAVARGDGEVVLAADTTVDLDGHVLGKPADDADARSVLSRLAGRTHRVHTGVALRYGVDHREVLTTTVVTTVVEMVPYDAELIDWYVATGEPRDKAGAYAVQGAGDALVARIDGSVSNVVGLPLATVVAMLRSGPGMPQLRMC